VTLKRDEAAGAERAGRVDDDDDDDVPLVSTELREQKQRQEQ